MKKFRLIQKMKPLLSITAKPLVVIAIVLISSATSFLSAQVFADLNPGTQNAVIQAFEGEMDLLRQEALDPQQGVSTESNKNIFYFYENVLNAFMNENVTLRDAFISELKYLQHGPVGNHKLTRAIFYRSIQDAPPMDRSALGSGNMTQNTGGSNTNKATNQVAPYLYFQTKEDFRTLIDNMQISSNNISALNSMFTYIRNNK